MLIDLTKPEKYESSQSIDFLAGKNTQTFLPLRIGMFVRVAFLLPNRVRTVPTPDNNSINGKAIINAEVEIRKMIPDFKMVSINKTTCIVVVINVKCLTVFII